MIAGASAISNSYGGADAADTTYGSYYNHPGIAVTAPTGDSGYQGGSYPASSSYVTAVGGTSLTRATTTSRGRAETVGPAPDRAVRHLIPLSVRLLPPTPGAPSAPWPTFQR